MKKFDISTFLVAHQLELIKIISGKPLNLNSCLLQYKDTNNVVKTSIAETLILLEYNFFLPSLCFCYKSYKSFLGTSPASQVNGVSVAQV